MTILSAVVFASFIASAFAACDNYCNGHGACQVNDVCACYDNWGMGLSLDSGDCSERVCPFEISWVDTPDKTGAFHRYSECAGRGICDRTSGECQCFDGFEGKGCLRQSCPNSCSGHGTCEYIEELGYRSAYNEYNNALGVADLLAPKELAYYGWDKGKSRACVCDAQYYDVDCSKRMCPFGNDVLDLRDDLLVSLKYQVQTLVFQFDYLVPTGSAPLSTFAITFKSKLNETYTTIPIVFNTNDMTVFTNSVQLALLNLPNKVVDGVSVAAAVIGTGVIGTAGGEVWMNVTFTGNAVQGPQYPLSIEAYECFNGCTPKISGLALQTRVIFLGSTSGEIVKADYNSYECGRRGKCDYTTGLCECFSGYSGENCNTLVTLL